MSFLRRFISSAIIIAFIILVIFIFPNWVYASVAATLAALAMYEFFSMVEKKGIQIYKYFGILLGLMIFFMVYMELAPFYGSELVLMVAAFITLFILQFMRRDNNQAIAGVSTTMFGIVYIGWLFSYMLRLKMFVNGPQLVAYLLLVTKAGDIGAYIIGSALGRHSLLPRISPKKTIEGALGGFLFSVSASLLSKFYLTDISLWHLMILGSLLGIIAQLGDLSESLIKRDCQIKDSSGVIPGIGGVLDLIDSILFTAPVFYFYLKIFL